MITNNDPPEAGTIDVPEKIYGNAPDIAIGDGPDDWHTHSPDWMDW